MRKTNFRRIFFYLKPHIRKHWLSFFLMFFGYGAGVLFDSIFKPYVYKELVDVLSSGGPKAEILKEALRLFVLFCVFSLSHLAGYRLGDFATNFFESKVMKELYDASFGRILRHSYHFFSNTFSGSLVAKSKRFVRGFESFVDILSYQIWFSLLTISGVTVVLFLQSRALALIFLGWSFLYLAVTVLLIRVRLKYDIQEAEADSLVTASLADSIQNVLNIKIFSGEKREEKNFQSVTTDEERKRIKAWNVGAWQNSIQAFMMLILQVGIMYLLIRWWYLGIISVGTVVLVQVYLFHLFDILWGLARALTNAVKALTDMKETVEIFDTEIEIVDPINPAKLRQGKGEIRFSNISFTYRNGTSIFKDFSLHISAGERLGLVGRSGAGKSTLTRLLLRFSDVEEGSITIDDQDIRHIAQDDLRRAVAYVPQEPLLFHRSIMENIAYGKPEATPEEIKEVARKAHADEFISKLPQGYNTLVGERGVKLSGGERQRVAIARAMLKDAPILVLDEATSSLDSISERYIQDAFSELMKNKTVIVVAHRLSTIQKLDRIIVLEDGRIAEEGTHAELLGKGGIYADLWSHQSGGFISE